MTLVELEQEIREEFPKFKVLPKSESRLMKVIDIFLKVITFGRLKTFMTGFTTVVSYTIYVTDSWDDRSPNSRMITLRHERVHMRQRKKYGAVLFTFLYLFFPFPVGLAYFRKKFEMEAYAETMKALVDLMPNTARRTLTSEVFRERMIGHFTTAQYFWMWPFKGSIERWYDDQVKRLNPPAS